MHPFGTQACAPHAFAEAVIGGPALLLRGSYGMLVQLNTKRAQEMGSSGSSRDENGGLLLTV